jgi:uncharacterized protein YjbI with pentapeptide repeats
VIEGASFVKSRLRRADLGRALAIGARFEGADLSDARLTSGDFSNSRFGDARLDGALLRRTRFSGADLSGVSGLTQSQLDLACGDSETRLPRRLTIASCD